MNQNGDFFWRRRRRRQGRGAGRGARRGAVGWGRARLGRRAGARARPPDLGAGSGSGARPARGLRGVWVGRGRALTCGAQRDGGGAGAGAGRAGGRARARARGRLRGRRGLRTCALPPLPPLTAGGRDSRGILLAGTRRRPGRLAGLGASRPPRRAASAKWPARLPIGAEDAFSDRGVN